MSGRPDWPMKTRLVASCDRAERSRRLPTDVVGVGVSVPTTSLNDVLRLITPVAELAEAHRRAILLRLREVFFSADGCWT